MLGSWCAFSFIIVTQSFAYGLVSKYVGTNWKTYTWLSANDMNIEVVSCASADVDRMPWK